MKPHLPQKLLTALIACIFAGTSFTHAADYSVYTSTAITTETGEVVTPAYGYTVVQWSGGATGTFGSNVNKSVGLCYGSYYTATYDAVSKSLTYDANGTAYATENGSFAPALSVVYNYNQNENWNTIMIDGNNSVPEGTSEMVYDVGGVRLSGLIVTSDSKVDTLKANNNNRNITLGKSEGSTGYTTIAKNFTLDMAGSSLTLAGTQVWNVDDNCTYTIKNAQNGNINSTADLTIGGAGKVTLTSALTNNGTLTVSDGATLTLAATMANTGTATFEEGAKLQISSLAGFSAVYSIDSEKSGLTTIDKKYAIYTGNAITGLNSFTLAGETQERTINADGTYAEAINAYVIAKDVTASLGSTEGLADAPLVAIAKGGTLNVDSELPTGWTVAGLLGEKVVGEGTLLISKSGLATGNANLTTIFAGTLELASGVTFTLGKGGDGQYSDGLAITTSTLTGVVLNNGSTLEYNANGVTTIQNLTVNKYSDENIGKATLHYKDSNKANSVNLTGVTQLNGNLDITTTYDGGFRMSQLSGAGALSVTGGQGTFNATILSLQGYTGSLSFSDSELVATVSTGTGEAVDMGSITATGVSSFTFNVQEDTSVDYIAAAGGTVNVAEGKALTLGSADVTTTSAIGTLSAASGSVSLAANTTLNLGNGTADSNHAVGTLTTVSGSVVNIASGSSLTLTSRDSLANNTVTGAGTLRLTPTAGSTITWNKDIIKDSIGKLQLDGSSVYELTSTSTNTPQHTYLNRANIIEVMEGSTLSVRLTNYTLGSTANKLILSGAGYGSEGAYNGAALALGYSCTYPGDVKIGYNVELGADATIWVTDKSGITGYLNEQLKGNGHTMTKTGAGELVLEKGADNASLMVSAGSLKLKENTTSEAVTVQNGSTLKLDEAATIIGKDGEAATITKVSMSSSGISTTATDGTTGAISNALVQLQSDATFSISDMALSNAVITTTEATPVVLQNVTAENTMLAGGKFTLNATPTVGSYDTEGSTGTMSYSIGLGVQTGASLTLNLDVLNAVGAEQHGVYDITITLSGFGADFSINSLDAIRGMVDFEPESWLAKSLASQGAVYGLSSGNVEDTPVAQGSVPTVTYSAVTGENVGSLVISINGLNIPEPTTATLSLLALVGLAMRRRRK